MHATRALLLLGLGLLNRAAALRVRSDGTVEEPVAGGSKTIIVELAKGSDVEDVKRKLQEQSASTTVLKTFESDVFTGISVETTDNNLESLEALAEAVKAWPMRLVDIPSPERGRTFSSDAAAKEYSLHKYTGVDKVHEAGIYGKGVVVAVVDTGIDYTHAALGAGFGAGYKVAGGYDLVGNGDYPTTPRQPDDDPKDQDGHGTHVAGIIAGKADHFTGVAPEATLRAYKVFGGGAGGTEEDVLIEAFLMAYKDGVDVITASIGGFVGWSDSAWAVVASRIVDSGVVVTISASNFGVMGPFVASSGSSGKNVIAVASSLASDLSADPFNATFALNGNTNVSTLAYVPSDKPWSISGMKIVPTSLNTSIAGDACQPLPIGTPSLNDSVALVRRGGCDFAVKQANVEALGAKHLLVYNDEGLWIAPYTPRKSSELALVEAKAGKAIVETIAAGGLVVVDFSQKTSYKVGVFNSAGGIPSDFTSWGPLFDLQIKPDVTAPGGNILSAYPDNQWMVMSGTSMACPYVAGVAALYISAYGGRKARSSSFGREMFQRIVSSGGALPWANDSPFRTYKPVDDKGFFAPVAQVGTGMVNAAKVLYSNTRLTFEPFALNDTANFRSQHEIAITNSGKEPVEYSFQLQPAAGIEIFEPYNPFGARNGLFKGLTSLEPISLVPRVSMPDPVTVAPGETRNVSFTFAAPAGPGVNASNMPLYSGKVLVTGGNGDSLSVPYLGVAFSLASEIKHMWRKGSPEFLWRTPKVWTFDLSPTAPGYPFVAMSVEYGSRQVRWDVYESGWTEDRWSYPPVVGENGYVGSATSFADTHVGTVFDPATMRENNTFAFPIQGVVRDTGTIGNYQFWWLGALANGSQIASGRYKYVALSLTLCCFCCLKLTGPAFVLRMRFAALRPFVDPKDSASWSVWDLPEITIERAKRNNTRS